MPSQLAKSASLYHSCIWREEQRLLGRRQIAAVQERAAVMAKLRELETAEQAEQAEEDRRRPYPRPQKTAFAVASLCERLGRSLSGEWQVAEATARGGALMKLTGREKKEHLAILSERGERGYQPASYAFAFEGDKIRSEQAYFDRLGEHNNWDS